MGLLKLTRLARPALALLLTLGMGRAQIATDGTLGRATTLTGPAYQIPDTLGRTVGKNLFHSFRTFDLAPGESATFDGPRAIANVLSRVTGGKASSIDGNLRCTIPGANFYFVNPAGVVFGPEASVDVDGSFAVMTADYLELSDGGRFDARNPANDVLTVAPPSAFGFLPPASGELPSIQFSGSQISMKESQNLTIAAGQVSMDNRAIVKAPGATLQVAAVASEGELPADGLATGAFAHVGNIHLREGARLSASSDHGGGKLLIHGGDLTLDGAAVINDAVETGGGRASEIEARGTLRLTGGAYLSSSAAGEARGGDLVITADRFEMEDADIYIWTGDFFSPGHGQGGDLKIRAREMTLDGSELSANTWGEGQGGQVELRADNLALNRGSAIGTSSYGSGLPGDVRIIVEHDLAMDGFLTQISSDALVSSTAPAGDIDIAAENLTLTSLASIGTRTLNNRVAGNITVHGVHHLSLDGWASINGGNWSPESDARAGTISIEAKQVTMDHGSWIGVGALENPAGSSRIQITADELDMQNGANLNSVARGQGRGGDIVVQAKTVNVLQGYIDASVYGDGAGGTIQISSGELLLDADGDQLGTIQAVAREGQGAGGTILLDCREVTLVREAQISAFTAAAGPGGSIRIEAGRLVVDASDISATSQAGKGGGRGGDIAVHAGDVQVRQSGSISSSTRGDGPGGTLTVKAGALALEGAGSINAETSGDGAGGSIQVEAGRIDLRDFSEISTEASKGGAAGRIDVASTAGSVDLERFSRISSSAFDGEAGSVTVSSAESITAKLDSRLMVQSENGNAGTVTLRAPAFIRLRDSKVSAQAGMNGGNITIDPNIFGLEDSTLTADARTGNGGHIELAADFIYQLGDSSITAISENESAQQGTVSIRSAVDFAGGLVALPVGLLGEASQMRDGCARRNPRANSLILRGKGGLSVRPDGFLLLPVLYP